MDFTAVIKTLEEQLAVNEAEQDRLFAEAGALTEAIKALRFVTSLEDGITVRLPLEPKQTKTGRPPVEDEAIQQGIALVREGVAVGEAAERVGVHRNTLTPHLIEAGLSRPRKDKETKKCADCGGRATGERCRDCFMKKTRADRAALMVSKGIEPEVAARLTTPRVGLEQVVAEKLEEGAGASAETGIPLHTVSAVMSTLEQKGVLETVGEVNAGHLNGKTAKIRQVVPETERRGIENHQRLKEFKERSRQIDAAKEVSADGCICTSRVIDGQRYNAVQPGCPEHGVDRNVVPGLKSPLANAGMF